MSGGVDSSVAAFLLKNQGHEVIGIFMKNWEDTDNKACSAYEDYEDVLSVGSQLNIPIYSFNFSTNYFDSVFTNFIDELKNGYTPNPDILCNREIKFKVLLKNALELGVDYLATGHYARISHDYNLLKSVDGNKDQTYFLYTLKQDILRKILFPIGEYIKSDIRKIAKDANLINHNKKDSTGICFIGKRKFPDFIKKYISPQKGLFKTPCGKIVGEHDGVWNYTIGQRKGMCIGGNGDAWFVVSKDVKTSDIIVVQGENHPLLFSNSLTASDLSWVESPPTLPFNCLAKIRYRQTEQNCTIKKSENGIAQVIFENPQRAITSRQSIVFYNDNICIGGGLIC